MHLAVGSARVGEAPARVLLKSGWQLPCLSSWRTASVMLCWSSSWSWLAAELAGGRLPVLTGAGGGEGRNEGRQQGGGGGGRSRCAHMHAINTACALPPHPSFHPRA